LLEVTRFEEAASAAAKMKSTDLQEFKSMIGDTSAICKAILEEYVSECSMFEVNISSRMRGDAILKANAFMDICALLASAPLDDTNDQAIEAERPLVSSPLVSLQPRGGRRRRSLTMGGLFSSRPSTSPTPSSSVSPAPPSSSSPETMDTTAVALPEDAEKNNDADNEFAAGGMVVRVKPKHVPPPTSTTEEEGSATAAGTNGDASSTASPGNEKKKDSFGRGLVAGVRETVGVIGRVSQNVMRSSGAPVIRRSAILGKFEVHEEAIKVYENAYEEILSMTEKNLLSAFKSSDRYMTLGKLSSLSETGGLSATIRRGADLGGEER